ncbi:MAG TPA: hypothetical protein VLM05_10425 [Mycobacteriales bacterium]|nr:hypothetical protein [Mycobacteriales bacterium]
MDDDVIGSEPERAPRPRRSVGGVAAPAGLPRVLTRVLGPLRRHGRVVAVVAVLVAVAGVVAISRAGVTGLSAAAPTPSPTPPPLSGEVLNLASGQNTIYAVASDCLRRCQPTLLASDDDGHAWSVLRLPGGAVTAPVARSWTLAVSGVEDLLAIEDPAAGVLTVGNGDTPFVRRKIVAGDPVGRVPAGRESMTRICARPRCATPTLEYIEPRTGRRGPLATQPPIPPRVLGVGGSQLWVAGIDPRTKRYALAMSVDDGASWRTVPLPKAGTDPALVPRLAPVPELDRTWFLQGYPDGDGVQSAPDLWTVAAPVPPPGLTDPPRRVRPDPAISSVGGVVGLKDGRLLLDGAIVLSPDGTQDRAALPDVESTRFVLRRPMRGPHLLVIAEALRTDGAASIAISASGSANDWAVRPIVLPR